MRTTAFQVLLCTAGEPADDPTAQRPSDRGGRPLIKPRPIPVVPPGAHAWYITFLVGDTLPGFNAPALITCHQDWTYSAVDGGDIGAISELPFNQASQQGGWRWSGEREFIATGMILSFSREEDKEGQLDNISIGRIEIKFREDLDEFTAAAYQDIWFCPDSFPVPIPLLRRRMSIPPGPVSIRARRLKAM